MKHSPLQLLRYLVPEISCTANARFNSEKDWKGFFEGLSVEVAVQQQQAPEGMPVHSWSVEMTISQKITEGQNFPYTIQATLLGFFACRDGLPADANEERFVRTNGSSMLYGAAREIIRSLTALGPWGEMMLPTVSFYDDEAGQKPEAVPTSKTDQG